MDSNGAEGEVGFNGAEGAVAFDGAEDAVAFNGEEDSKPKAGVDDVKPEIKAEFEPDFKVKEEPEIDAEGTGKRSRKSKVASMAELSGSDESDMDKPPKKKGRASAGRGRGKKLENIDGASPGTAKRGRGRGKAGTPTAARGRGGRVRTPAKKYVEAEEEEEEEDMEESGDDAQISGEGEESEDDYTEGSKKGKAPTPTRGKGRGRGGARGGKAGKGKAAKAPKGEEQEEEEEEDAEVPAMNDAAVNDLSGPVRTGQFMLEKNDMRHLENYPIWRMEGPNMLRKFEMFVSDGKVRHKSLYAYSSWAQSMQELYTRIQVQQLSSSDGEIVVEVKKDYVPQPPALETLEAQYGADGHLPVYNTFLQVMYKQALDSKTLTQVKETADPIFMPAIEYFDTLVANTVKQIESEVNMKEEFMTRVKNCPNMKGIKRQNWSQTDQATVDKVTEKGVRSVLMFGFGYDAFLMTEDSSRGVEVAQEIIIGATMEKYLKSYHGLTHFKFHLLKRCVDKVKMEKGLDSSLNDDQILERCTTDRSWIMQAFEDFKTLLSY